MIAWGAGVRAADRAAEQFRSEIEPILADRCYACHGNGSKKGGVVLDDFATDQDLLARKDLWLSVLKNVRAGLMPPPGKDQPSAEEKAHLEAWIKRGAFGLDPRNPDPGRVTLRRLNRVEYRNTIRDLMGIDFRADEEFPVDDNGYGFDNIGEVLTVSPLLLEKYMLAAETIVAEAVPASGKKVEKVRSISGKEFKAREGRSSGDFLAFTKPSAVEYRLAVPKSGTYHLTLDFSVHGAFDFDPARARVAFAVDGKELSGADYGWNANKKVHHEFDVRLRSGPNILTMSVTPLPTKEPSQQPVFARLGAVTVKGGPGLEEWVRPKNFERFFDRDDPRTDTLRRTYAREVLSKFVGKAYRRPVDAMTIDRLVKIAEEGYKLPDRTVEQGIGRAMVAVLASPRFLFRLETSPPPAPGQVSSPVDEFALASRLSYFLWSTMPDDELIRLASQGKLRANQAAQVKRMLADPKSEALVTDFAGQWLQVRDFEHFPIQQKVITRRENLPKREDGEVNELKRLMRRETEQYVGGIIREDRNLVELIDSDYTYLNETLAKHYEIPGVEGRDFRKVTLPKDSPRGGLLTQAGVLMVTSNPTRTSPVKRGQFILENFLGTPTPPPPPDIPSLEDAFRDMRGREPTVREAMEVHRKDPLCSSCHNRMDPLGLALENFNALGMYRTTERGKPIDAAGKLLDGSEFKDIRELKAILKDKHRDEFYHCLAEKLLTYALGRGLDYYDIETLDAIVARLKANDGKFSALLMGVIESAPFQKRRTPASTGVAKGSAAKSAAIPTQPPTAARGLNR
ncbi:DUF1592 domain-containing protein [Tundrisphaera sp. TA3]|uniref:DUF1592 domain-containing protein n=1 Tax=Tundrisphaera sp. TA3 TaxID=3435775 RepID=UPI003EB9EB51